MLGKREDFCKSGYCVSTSPLYHARLDSRINITTVTQQRKTLCWEQPLCLPSSLYLSPVTHAAMDPFSKSFLAYCSAPSDRKQNVSSFLGHYFIGGSFPVTAADEILGAAKKGRRVEDEEERGGGKDKNRRKEKGKQKKKIKRERRNASKSQSFPTCDPITRSCIPSRCKRLDASGGCGVAPALAAEACGLRAVRARRQPLYLSLPYLPRGGGRGVGWGRTDYLVLW